MEINKFTDIVGVVLTEAVVEGRMVLLAQNTQAAYDFGSRSDLPGARRPADDTEAGRAKFVVTWPVSNARAHGPIKMFVPQPSLEWALRQGGWDQAANVPFSADVHLTYPGQKDGVTIPSGSLALAFDRGVFTVPSGSYVYSDSLRNPGATLEVLNIADDTDADAGKLAYASGGTIAVTEHFDVSTYALTFRTL
jgi:hypothetical protein